MIHFFMGKLAPFSGILDDIKGRAKFYKQDWTNGFAAGFRILAPTAYIFFASGLPVIVFGEQLHKDTDGTLSAVETLTSTALCGVLHSIIGGQPLIVLGVNEPTVYLYTFLYKFAKTKASLGQHLFVAWAGWVCVWTSLLLIAFAVLGQASSISKRFTRIVGELFETLVALLFIQQAIKGMVGEFGIPHGRDSTLEEFQLPWRYVNGFSGLLLCFGLLVTALKTRSARSWRYASGWLRGFTADYGVPLMVLFWTGVSYALVGKTATTTSSSDIAMDIPRRLSSPNPWDANPTARWRIIEDMGEVPYAYILMAVVPAVMLAGLYIFDHSAAAQMAEQETFNLRAPSAHHYDMLLLGLMVLICGLLGVPPCSGLIPQSPMHTKSLAKLNKQMVRRRLVETAKKGIEERVTLAELYDSMQEVYREFRTPSPQTSVDLDLKDLKELKSFKSSSNSIHYLMESTAPMPVDRTIFDPEKDVDALLPVTVNEQRLTNLAQALLVGGCVGAMPLIRKIPVSVLWGYFLYMAIETLQGNQFWERLLLVLTAPSRRYKVLEEFHASFVETVPFRTITTFTVFQVVYLLISFGMTWIPVAGILFPIVFFALVLIRQYILPILFEAEHLRELDAAKYEEAPAIPHERAVTEAEVHGLGKAESMRKSVSDAEILDDITTRARGELKVCPARMEHWTAVEGSSSTSPRPTPRSRVRKAAHESLRIVPIMTEDQQPSTATVNIAECNPGQSSSDSSEATAVVKSSA